MGATRVGLPRVAQLAGLIAALVLSAAAPALAAPSVTGTIGGTTAILGGVKEGGLSLSLALLWPLDFHGLETGVSGHADDFGSVFEDLTDPSTGGSAGRAEGVHRAAYSAAYRLDARPFPRLGWEPFASGTWGVYRLRDDRLGDTRREWSSTGWSLAAGVRHVLHGRATIGAEMRYHRLFNDHAGRGLAAGLRLGGRGFCRMDVGSGRARGDHHPHGCDAQRGSADPGELMLTAHGRPPQLIVTLKQRRPLLVSEFCPTVSS